MLLRSRRGRVGSIPRSRGLVAGLALVVLGAWGAVIPFVGPEFHYAFGSYGSFHFTWERLWLDIVPGVAAVIGGLLLISTGTRRRGLLGGCMAAAGGVWFAVGVPLSTLWQGVGHLGIGPALGGQVRQAAEWVGFFYGLGAAIIFLAAFCIGRLSVVSVRDSRVTDDRLEAEGARTPDLADDRATEQEPELVR